MKLPCKVIEDMLPMYFDCLCSEESAALVEQHLKDCPGCSRMLAQLQTPLELTQASVDDVKPLAAIQEKWKKSKRTNIKKGICIALAAVFAVAAVLTGAWYFSYGKIFYNMARSMTPVAGDTALASDADHRRELDGFCVDLWMPTVFGSDGYARVDGGDGVGLFLYPQANGDHLWKLYITDESGRTRFVYMNEDLTPDFESHDTLLSAEQEKEKVRQLISAREQTISAMVEAVKKLWGIDLLRDTD